MSAFRTISALAAATAALAGMARLSTMRDIVLVLDVALVDVASSLVLVAIARFVYLPSCDWHISVSASILTHPSIYAWTRPVASNTNTSAAPVTRSPMRIERYMVFMHTSIHDSYTLVKLAWYHIRMETLALFVAGMACGALNFALGFWLGSLYRARNSDARALSPSVPHPAPSIARRLERVASQAIKATSTDKDKIRIISPRKKAEASMKDFVHE